MFCKFHKQSTSQYRYFMHQFIQVRYLGIPVEDVDQLLLLNGANHDGSTLGIDSQILARHNPEHQLGCSLSLSLSLENEEFKSKIWSKLTSI